ncbi:MAG: hypothetical protein ACE5JQ_06380 [Candidatus Methylomirabilales bacterium]
MRAKKSGLLLILILFAAAAAGLTTPPFPEDLLRGEQGQSLKEVVEGSTLQRQVSGLRVYGKPAVFQYLSTHPDFAAGLARAADVLKYTVERRGDAEYWANDHDGLTAHFAILRAEPGRMVVYGKGTYKKGIFRIPGRIALVMQYYAERDRNSPYVQNTVSGYVRIDAGLFDALARLFRSAVERRVDKKVNWFLGKANQLMTRLYEDPEAILQKLPSETWQVETAHLRALLATSQTDFTHRSQARIFAGLRQSVPQDGLRH